MLYCLRMFWRKRRREIVKVFRRQAEFLRAQELAQQDGTLTTQELATLRKQQQILREDIQRIAPPLPLTWKEWLIRFGVVCFLLMIGSGILFWQAGYLVPESHVVTTGEVSDTVESRFVPTTSVNVYDLPLVTQVSFSEPNRLASFDRADGVTVGVVPDGTRFSVLYTQPTEAMRLLTRHSIDADARPVGDAQTLIPDQDIIDASVLPLSTGEFLLAAALQTEHAIFIRLERRDQDWQPVGQPTLLKPLEGERVDGLGIFATGRENTPYVLLTMQEPDATQGVTATRQIVARFFDQPLYLSEERLLETPVFHTDAHAAYLPSVVHPDTHFTVITNGGSPFDYDRLMKGDELFSLLFDETFAPVEYFRLTNNGRPHDYWPESFHIDKNFVYIAALRQYVPPQMALTDQRVLPEQTGNIYVYVARADTWDIVGTLFIAEFTPQPLTGGDAKIGGRRAHITKQGKRLYVVYDRITVDDPYVDHPTREVMGQWFDLNQ